VRGRRKRLVGRVTSSQMQKTAVVVVERTHRHPRYGKVVRVRKKFYAHDEGNACQVGDVVRIVQSRPLSRLKRWVVEEILEQREMPEEAIA
jgi:small subunit ribosomal protein S17